MAGSCYYYAAVAPSPTLQSKKLVDNFRCCSAPLNNRNNKAKAKATPQLLNLAVTGVTELLRFLSSTKHKSDTVSYEQSDDNLVSGVDDVLMILKSDYENAYFVTGFFTSTIYTEDCIFEDPTIKFRGKDLYSRNLKLLVPFFDRPSIVLQRIEKGVDSEASFVFAKWKLRTYLKLPWRPLIAVDGSTVYDLDDKFKIVRHAESWDISALEAIAQIFTPSSGDPGD